MGVKLNVTITGGTRPYNRTWFGLPVGCASSNASSIVCDPYGSDRTGSYTVSIQVQDAVGTIVTSASTTFQLNAKLAAAVDPLPGPSSGTVPLSTTASAIVTGGTSPFTYEWDWGDGTNNSTGSPVSHVYTTEGRFEVNLTVNDSLGESYTAHWPGGVTSEAPAPPPPTPPKGSSPLSPVDIIIAIAAVALAGCAVAAVWIARRSRRKPSSPPGGSSPRSPGTPPPW
ncbi:MAG: PKD domain-containing protein [Thermoplasmata archaeon]